jgi:hypothetical protein
LKLPWNAAGFRGGACCDKKSSPVRRSWNKALESLMEFIDKGEVKTPLDNNIVFPLFSEAKIVDKKTIKYKDIALYRLFNCFIREAIKKLKYSVSTFYLS